jgi:hypothetical protein
MSKVLRIALACGLLSTLTACTVGDVAPDATLNSPSDAYYVIGLSPPQTRALVVQGAVTNGVFEQRHVPLTPFVNVPTDGFLIGHSGSGRTLELQQVFDERHTLIRGYAPCKTGAKALVFDAPPGTVVYITSVTFVQTKDGLVPFYASDLEGARAFMKTHYPALADKLEQGHYQLLTPDNECGAIP